MRTSKSPLPGTRSTFSEKATGMRQAARVILGSLPILMLAAGCASEGYAPPRYQAAQSRFGAIHLTTTKKVYVCPTMDRLTPENRAWLDAKVTAWEHATDAVEQELKASGLKPVRTTLAFGPGFDSLQQVLADKADKNEKAVYLGTALLWLSAHEWSMDARLFAPTGAVLFEKRGICAVFGSDKEDTQEITHMALRQILADPAFQKALQP